MSSHCDPNKLNAYYDDELSGEQRRAVEAVPELPIVVEHLGGVNHPVDDPQQETLRRQVFELARFPNLYLKIHGLGEFCRRAMPPRATRC